jgi:hypothetical protein
LKKFISILFIGFLILSGIGSFASHNKINDNFNLLIITSSIFSDEIQLLKEHKEKHEILTKIVTLDDIYNSIFFPNEGRDDAERIKYFIKNAYDNWNISFVLLVGGPALIPIRRCNTIPLEDVPVDFTSELYYADIYDKYGVFSTWDSDEDNLFSEWYNNSRAEDVQQDLIPEVGLGRLPCYDIDEVNYLIQKIVDYESTPSDFSWFNKMVVAGGETFLEFEGLEGEINTQKALDVMSGFIPVKLWYSNGNLDRFGFRIAREISKGCGFLYLVGHGNSYSWVTLNPEGRTESLFTVFHVPLLSNRQEYPVCILSGCHVCKIEKSFCLGWQLVRQRNKGSIATIGPTNVGYYGFTYNGGGLDWLELQFFKEYMNGSKYIGDIWRQVLTKFAEQYPIDWSSLAGENCAIDVKMAQEWVLIGDPSLKIGGYS